MVSISHLVVIGCSFSYGDGLTNPKEDSWAGRLSKKLNVPIVNLSSRGGGNDRIMRRLYEYHYLDSANFNNPFYVIAFSHSSRREEYIRKSDDYQVVDMKNDSTTMKAQPFSEHCILNYNSVVAARKKLMFNSYILDFLKLNDINYLSTDFIPDNESELSYLRHLYPQVHDRIYSDKFRMKDLSKISIKYPPLPCGHDGVDAQIEMTDYIYDVLNASYGTPAIIKKNYTTLQQYRAHYGVVGSRGDNDWL
jgi:hypothetical protein